jgi:hypothetical protein
MSYPNIILTTDPNLSFAQYDFIQIVHDENNYIEARVVSYNTSTGELIASPIHHHGSGSFNDWKIILAGEPGSIGTSGQAGTSGTSGTSGTDGTSGTSGTDGTSGTSGSDGTSGEDGTTGTSGTSGTSNLLASTEWNIEREYQISSNEQLTFSGDYVLEDSNLYIEGSDEQVEYSANKFFKKTGKIFIGGNLLLKNSQIENDGEISVGGQIILIDDSQITGTGTII